MKKVAPNLDLSSLMYFHCVQVTTGKKSCSDMLPLRTRSTFFGLSRQRDQSG